MNTRRNIIAGNWKMNLTTKEAEELVNTLMRQLYQIENSDIVICPPFTLLAFVGDMLSSGNIALGAQDIFWEEKGAFTGEISPIMLKDVGCQYVIIGHSERRQFFGETNQNVNKKIKAALKIGLTPIVCVGENLKEREGNLTFDVIKNHIQGAFENLSKDDVAKCVIAYEPVWAIGTGRNATGEQAQEVHKFSRSLLTNSFGKQLSEQLRIQYGGSVRADNIEELIKKEDIDGALVGGASLKADEFSQIVKISSAA